jgi:hypothetical protein
MCFFQQKEIDNFAKSENQGPKKKKHWVQIIREPLLVWFGDTDRKLVPGVLPQVPPGLILVQGWHCLSSFQPSK